MYAVVMELVEGEDLHSASPVACCRSKRRCPSLSDSQGRWRRRIVRTSFIVI